MSFVLDDTDTILGQIHTISYTWGGVYENPRNRIDGRIFRGNWISIRVLLFPKVLRWHWWSMLLFHFMKTGQESLICHPLAIKKNMTKMGAENFGEASGYIRYTC